MSDEWVEHLSRQERVETYINLGDNTPHQIVQYKLDWCNARGLRLTTPRVLVRLEEGHTKDGFFTIHPATIQELLRNAKCPK